ncbi:hypothetical protein K439DRAFT_1307070, partial [Ramaria rubella]
KAKAKAKEDGQQTVMTDHYQPVEPGERIIPYSDELFKQVALEWLVETDQPIHTLEHPKLKEMIDIASCAKHGVCIPTNRATCAGIMEMFCEHLCDMAACINV